MTDELADGAARDRLRQEVEAVVEAWCQDVGAGPLEDDGALCEACLRSGMLEVLGDFALLPHAPIHALVGVLGEIVDAEVGGIVRLRFSQLNDEWHGDLHPGADGGDPLDPDDYHALRRWYQTVRDEIAADAADLDAFLRSEQRAIVAEVTARWAFVGATVSRNWIMGSLEHGEPAVSPVRRDALAAAIDVVLEQWMLWLPDGHWRQTAPIPAGARCVLCDGSGILSEIDGPHGALHTLREALAELREQAAVVTGPVLPESDPAARRVRAGEMVAELLAERAEVVRRALATWVGWSIDEEVRDAARWVPVAGDDVSPPDGGAAAG